MSFDFNKLTKRPSLPTKLMLTIRLILGGYLLYIVYDLRESVFSPEFNIFFILSAVVFIVCGGIIVFFSARDLLQGRYLGGPLDDTNDTDSAIDTDDTNDAEAIDNTNNAEAIGDTDESNGTESTSSEEDL